VLVHISVEVEVLHPDSGEGLSALKRR
jgi:hypothetical protein